jgi:AbiJ N-terminal domain 4
MEKKPEQSAPDPLEARKRMTFEQAEGVEPLPTQLKLKELSPALRAALWAVVLESVQDCYHAEQFGSYVGEPWASILKDYHIYRLHRMADTFSVSTKVVPHELKTIFEKGDYVKVFGFLQFVLRHSECPFRFAEAIEAALRFAHAAYRVVERRTIFPIGSEAENETIKRTFADLAATEFHGARQHLRNAAEELAGGNNSGSIREGIHAVESVVSVLEPKGDFAKALAKLDAKVKIHGAMKAGFGSLYGFTSDEKGIRHPLADLPAANVDETDALFMIGACAAFVSYLINKSRAAGLLKK